ncbi:hypothetical protein CsSME_00020336 [Camellia sinensis var. sinensis]
MALPTGRQVSKGPSTMLKTPPIYSPVLVGRQGAERRGHPPHRPSEGRNGLTKDPYPTTKQRISSLESTLKSS